MDDRLAGGQDRLRAQLGAVQGLRVEGLKIQGVGGDGGDGAGKADQPPRGGQVDDPLGLIEQATHLGPGGGLDLGGDAARQEALGDTHAAGVQADGGTGLIHAQDQLGGAAPEVDNEPRRRCALARPRRALVFTGTQERAGEGQAGLLLAADDLGLDAQQAPDPGHEVLAVAGVAGGGGGYEAPHVAPGGDAQLGAVGGVGGHGGQSALQGLGVEQAGAVHALAQAHDLVTAAQHLQAGTPGVVAVGPGDEEADGVGAAVDCGDAGHGGGLLGSVGKGRSRASLSLSRSSAQDPTVRARAGPPACGHRWG